MSRALVTLPAVANSSRSSRYCSREGTDALIRRPYSPSKYAAVHVTDCIVQQTPTPETVSVTTTSSAWCIAVEPAFIWPVGTRAGGNMCCTYTITSPHTWRRGAALPKSCLPHTPAFHEPRAPVAQCVTHRRQIQCRCKHAKRRCAATLAHRVKPRGNASCRQAVVQP